MIVEEVVCYCTVLHCALLDCLPQLKVNKYVNSSFRTLHLYK